MDQFGLPAYDSTQAQAGHLVLFPSTMWHGTTLFVAGERLTVAFDVRSGVASPD